MKRCLNGGDKTARQEIIGLVKWKNYVAMMQFYDAIDQLPSNL